MKLIRFGPPGHERSGLLLGDGTRIDATGFGESWGETFFETDGKTFGRQEQDTNKDGKPDRWIQFRAGKRTTQLDDRNADGRPDSTLFYDAAESPTQLEEDTNLDGENDKWITYRDGKTAVIEQDRDFDEQKDLRAELEPDGTKRLEQQDTDQDGKYDVAIHFEKGQRVRLEEDTNADGKVDVVTHTRGEEILRREADTDHDGRLESVAFFEKGKERRQTRSFRSAASVLAHQAGSPSGSAYSASTCGTTSWIGPFTSGVASRWSITSTNRLPSSRSSLRSRPLRTWRGISSP